MPTTEHACPRCGYDLGAEVSKWTEQCPLRGRCWECGLDLEWRDVVDAWRVQDDRFVEHVAAARVLAAAWRTWWWAWRPTAFWTRIRLELLVVPRRWTSWARCVLGGAYVAGGVLGSLRTAWSFGLPPPATVKFWFDAELLSIWAAPIGSVVPAWRGVAPAGLAFEPAWRGTIWGEGYVWALAATLMFPFMLAVVSRTLASAKVRGVHIARAGVYAAGGLVVWPFAAFVRAVIDKIDLLDGRPDLWVMLSPRGPSLSLTDLMDECLAALVLAWTARYWWCVLRIGWRIERPARIYTAAAAPTCLAVAVLMCVDEAFIRFAAAW